MGCWTSTTTPLAAGISNGDYPDDNPLQVTPIRSTPHANTPVTWAYPSGTSVASLATLAVSGAEATCLPPPPVPLCRGCPLARSGYLCWKSYKKGRTLLVLDATMVAMSPTTQKWGRNQGNLTARACRSGIPERICWIMTKCRIVTRPINPLAPMQHGRAYGHICVPVSRIRRCSPIYHYP